MCLCYFQKQQIALHPPLSLLLLMVTHKRFLRPLIIFAFRQVWANPTRSQPALTLIMAYLTCSEGGSRELHLLGGTQHCTIVMGTHPFDMERNRRAARGWKLLTDRGKRGPEEVSPGKWQAISVSPTCGPVGAINSPLRALPHRVGQPFPAGFKQTRCHQQLQGIHCSSYQCAIVWAASSSL